MHLRDHHADTWDRFSAYLTIGPDYMKEIGSVLIRITKQIHFAVRGHRKVTNPGPAPKPKEPAGRTLRVTTCPRRRT